MRNKYKILVTLLVVFFSLGASLDSFAQSSNQTICLRESDFIQCDDGNLINGYWWRKKVWIPSYPSIETLFTPAPILTIGRAVYYDPGVMMATAKARGIDTTGYMDGVALMSCSDLGLIVWLKRPEYDWEGPFIVVDCAESNDIFPIVKYRKESVEVGADTAEKWGLNKKRPFIDGVLVSKINPKLLKGSNIQAVDFVSWWLNNYKPAAYLEWVSPKYFPPHRWIIGDKDIYFYQPIGEIPRNTLYGKTQ